MIATVGARHGGVNAAIDDDHRTRRMRGHPARAVDQMLVEDGLAAAHAGVGGKDDFGCGVVDTRCKAGRGESAEDNRVNGADARASQHREHRLGNHRHVNEHTVATPDAQFRQHRRTRIDLCGQFAIREVLRGSGFGGDVDERPLIGPRGKVPVDRVVAKVGVAADEPARKRRAGIIQHLRKWLVPVDERCLLAPESLAIG